MQIDFIKITYLFFRLSPFIIVCYFTLLSVFNQDAKGLIYLAGLLMTCMIVSSVGEIPGIKMVDANQDKSDECKVTYLGVSDEAISKTLPLSMAVLSYTYWYLFVIIGENKMWAKNTPLLVLFPILMLADAWWQSTNGCNSIGYSAASFFLAGGLGAIWSVIISSTGLVELQIFNGISGSEVCSRPTRSNYRCRIKKEKDPQVKN
jgi:hypothetical protein